MGSGKQGCHPLQGTAGGGGFPKNKARWRVLEGTAPVEETKGVSDQLKHLKVIFKMYVADMSQHL